MATAAQKRAYAKKLKDGRTSRGWSQADLAVAATNTGLANVTQSSVSDWETAQQAPRNWDVVAAVAAALELGPELHDLLGLKPKPSRPPRVSPSDIERINERLLALEALVNTLVEREEQRDVLQGDSGAPRLPRA